MSMFSWILSIIISAILQPPSLPHALFSSPFLCCQKQKHIYSYAKRTVKLNKNKEAALCSCLQCVTQLFLRLFLPPLFIIFPLSYICLRQLSWEVFVTKKPSWLLTFCLHLLIRLKNIAPKRISPPVHVE